MITASPTLSMCFTEDYKGSRQSIGRWLFLGVPTMAQADANGRAHS